MSRVYPWLEAIQTEFIERRSTDRMAHALLISGPSHLGKVQAAVDFMRSLLCIEESYPACGTCRSCQLLASGAHPDGQIVTFEMDPKKEVLRKEIIVDQVRRLIAFLQLTRTFSPRKAALIHPAEAMNINAANALLKTLEEPPGESILILVTSNPARLPATIRSRCQNLHVRPPEPEQALEWLSSTVELQDSEAALALEAAAGSPLQALNMVREGSVDQYRLVSDSLDTLLAAQTVPGQLMAGLSEIDPELLWSWLSLRAARELRQRKDSLAGARYLSELQAQADRNRGLTRTSVRNDLLLQDWLIQWSRIAA